MVKILILIMSSFLHPVHVSLMSLDQEKGSDSLNVFVRMYYDDFLLDYRLLDRSDDITGSLASGGEFPSHLMNNYISKKVNIKVNNKELKGKLLKVVEENNEISINIFYDSVKKPRIVSVRNLIMTELHSDQANMIIVRVNEYENGVKLTPENNEQTFKIKSN